MRTIHRLTLLAVFALFVLTLGTASAQTPGRAPKAGGRKVAPAYAPDHLLVRMRHGTPPETAEAIHRGIAAEVLRRYRSVDGLSLVRIPPGLTVAQARRRYREHPQVLYAEPDYIVRLDRTPNDPEFRNQWALNNTGQFVYPILGTPGADIDALEAWNITTGSSNVVIGVIDTGIDYTHPDLAANIYRNQADCNSNGIDDDHDGYVDDCYGIDTFNHDSDPMDDHYHGTHVAGTIGAVGDNGIGVAGVAWQVKLAACKFISSEGWGYTSGAIACLDYFAWLKDHGVNIIATSNSWGGGGYLQALIDAIDGQRDRNILFVAAAGNDSADTDVSPAYPASYDLPNIISVAATHNADYLAGFSNYGRLSVDLAAPGYGIRSTMPGNNYGDLSGTSMAAPHVSGVIALLKAQNPSRDWKALKNLVLVGGDDKPELADKTLSGKRLDAYGALTCSDRVLQSRLRPAEPLILVPPGSTVPLTFLSLKCAQAFGPVQVTVTETGQVIDLRDDGVAPDTWAGDGIFAGSFSAAALGGYTLNFPVGDTVFVSVEAGYSYQATDYNYRNIAGTNLNLTDDSFAAITLPFPIRFANAQRSTLYVSSNGIVSFHAGITEPGNPPLPTAINDAIVAPFWADLYPAPGNVFYEVIGSAPNRELVIEWRNMSGYWCTSDDSGRFQVVFSEATSDVLFNYADVEFGYCDWSYDYGYAATVGIQIHSRLATQYSFNEPRLSNGLALLWTMTGDNPSLVITALSPSTRAVNSGDFTLNVDGSGLVYASEVLWNGAPRPTSYVQPGRVAATIPNSDIAALGSATVTVRNPAPGGGESNALLFNITPPGTLHVVTPNGGEVWPWGVNQTISWTYTGDPGPTVRIELFRREGEKEQVYVIGANVPVGSGGSGMYSWKVLAPWFPDLELKDYKIRIRSEAYPTAVLDTSDAGFTILSQVHLISPNGGETWAAGSTQTISWTYAGNLPGTTMYISLSAWNAQVPIGANGSGSYTFTVPADLPARSDYRVEIYAGTWKNGSDGPWDRSDADFSVVPPLTAVSVTPNSGSGTAQTFSFLFSDTRGANKITYVQALINSSLAWYHSCAVLYYQSTNRLYLVQDSGTGWQGPLTPGQAGTLSNSQCTLNAGASSISAVGNNLTVNAALSFKGTFGGSKTVFLDAEDTPNKLSSGFRTLGTWTVPSAPTAVSVTPSSGTGSSQTFALLYSDAAGVGKITYVQALINSSLAFQSSCSILYYQSTNRLYLIQDSGAGWQGPLIPGQAGTLQNSQCTLNAVASSVSAVGNNLTVNAALTFKAAFGGTKTVYMDAEDTANHLSSGWQSRGSWTVPASPPTAVSVTPSSGTGSSQTFALLYSDAGGAGRITYVQALINGSLSFQNSCAVLYYQSTNRLYLVLDSGTGWQGPLTPGQVGTLSNNQCTLDGGASSVSAVGNNLTVNAALTSQAAFTGSKTVYLDAEDTANHLSSGWQTLGSWTVP